MRKSIVLGLAAACVVGCGQGDATGTEAASASTAMELLRSGAERATAPAFLRESLARGGLRLVRLQADQIGDSAGNSLEDEDPDDGGWDFTLQDSAEQHSSAPSTDNTYGATALGLFAALRSGGASPRLNTAALGAGLGSQGRAEVDSPPDFVFLSLLAERVDDPGFAELARARYDAKVAAAGGALALGTSIRELRHRSGNDGLIAYDLAWLMLAARALDATLPEADYAAQAGTFAGLVTDDLRAVAPRFAIEDSAERYYVQGLAWSLLILSENSAEAALAERVRQLLLSQQQSDGAFPWNAASTESNVQATAHVVQALSLATEPANFVRSAARRGARWLARQQRATGSWVYGAGLQSPLLDGEALLALELSVARSAAALTPDRADDGAVASSSAALSPAGGEVPPLAEPW